MNSPNFSAMGTTGRPALPPVPAMQQPQGNPLKNFFRQAKLYIRLPSGDSYYPPGVVEFSHNGELGIMAMTGQDELILKNPDALLNGDALVQVIKSCVPGVQNPKALLNNDIDVLITAIRYVTYNDKLETLIACPECKHENNYKIDLEHCLNNMSFLDSDYVIHLESGLSLYIKPYGFEELLKSLHAQFEQSKIARAVASPDITDQERAKILNEVFVSIAKTTFELTVGSVIRIVNESQGIDVTNRGFIEEFIRNSDKDVTDRIRKLSEEINQIGIEKHFTATCEKCGHSWKSEIDFNPVNFS